MGENIKTTYEQDILNSTNNARFDINPHIVRQLGGELVPDDITALMELVKNAYDADSPYVRININTKGSYSDENLRYPNNRGYIVIEDGGFGMDEATILKSWLTISYSKKRADENNIKAKTPAGRTPLGDKGLGRLSTQRLADCCEIFTCSDGSNEKLHVAFDWREFDKADQLSKVPVFFERVATSQGKGTKLILTNLHRPATWEGDELASLKGQLSQLISPFIENRPFLVYMTVNGESIEFRPDEEDNYTLDKFINMTEDKHIIVKYVKKDTSVIVKHVTEEGVDLVEPETIEGKVGDPYDTEEKEFDDYEIKTIPENADGQMTEEQIEVVYVYSQIKGKVTITKVDKDDTSKLLEGATYKIEKVDEEGNVDGTFATQEKTTGENGQVEFVDLTVGKYKIVEIKAPEGYELNKSDMEIEITKEQRELSLIATNMLKLEMPETGGMNNTILVSIVGIGIMVISTVGLKLRKKTK